MVATKTLIFISGLLTLTNGSKRPHIIFVVADDLGWNDVGFHGSSEIPTPNIDALAYSGLILNNYYVTPICTPSRSALMTGKYPIHTGMQHSVLYGAEPRGLPLTEKLLPEYLRDLGYVNRIVGKWHLGSYKKEYTPLFRGFLTHLGFWTGHHDYFDHTAMENSEWGLDFRRNLDVAYDLHGQYSTDIFTKEATKIIKEHNISQPLFLYLAHAAVHSGNPYEPLRSPDLTLKKFEHIENYERKRFAGMLSKLDDSVGEVVNSLRERKMLENCIIIFTTDNGGPAAGFNLNAASNYPLRGVKNTLWEGGIRGAGLIWSPLIQKPSRVATQLFHITDWLPTLLSAVVNSDGYSLEDIDGFNLWPSLSEDLKSSRTEVLHNIDDIYGNAALTVGTWKILKGTTYNGAWDSWYGPSGRNYTYDVDLVLNSLVGKTLNSMNRTLLPVQIKELRGEAEVDCSTTSVMTSCKPLETACLFNVDRDPCELNNEAERFPEILSNLERALNEYNLTAVPPANKPIEPYGNPELWNYVWTNFGDYINYTRPVYSVLIE